MSGKAAVGGAGWTVAPQKYVHMFIPSPVHGTGFGERVFADEVILDYLLGAP